MTQNQLRTAMLRQPFRPFSLILADGRSFSITHPEWMALSPNGREITLYEENGTQHFLDAFLVAQIMVQVPSEAESTAASDSAGA